MSDLWGAWCVGLWATALVSFAESNAALGVLVGLVALVVTLGLARWSQ